MTVKTPAVLKAQFLSTDPADQMSDLIDAMLANAASMIPPGGTWFYVDGANGSDSNTGLTWTAPLLTLPVAYALTTTGKNDVVCLLASTGAVNAGTAITWSKNLTHLIGLGAPTHAAQRTRIVCSAVDLSPFITISGYGCIFSNLYIWQGQDDADSLINVRVSGNRNYFDRVHFAGGGHATQAIDAGASLQISGGSENLFERCTIGVDTVAAGTGMAGLVYAATGGAARNVFKDCLFTLYAGHANAIFVELLGNAGIDRYQIFERCKFINLSATEMVSAFAIATPFDSNNKRFLMFDCEMIGAAAWDNNDRGAVSLNNKYVS